MEKAIRTIGARPRLLRRSALLSCVLTAAALVFAGSARPVSAGEAVVNTGLMQLAQSEVTPLALPNAVIPPPEPAPGLNPYALADTLKIRGWIIPLPGASDTIDRGLFGFRNTLAENGISYFGISATTFQDNLLRHGLPAGNYFGKHSRDNQLYNGQLPTYITQEQFYAMYDLQRFGIPDGQLQFGFSLMANNWNPAGADGFFLLAATYYQTFLDKRIEIKVGQTANSVEFLGSQVGGSLASGVFGPNAGIPIENGLNSSGTPSLGANIKFNLPNNFYDKAGVNRALSPDGTIVERLNNPSALSLKVRNSGAIFIDEVGYRVPALPGQMQMWIRAAASVTNSRYRELANTANREQPNYGLYFLADRQLLQTAPNTRPGSARQGIYAGFTIDHTPSYFNAFSTYYEGRLYGFGLIPGRPNDLVSAVANHNDFSGAAVHAARARGLLAHGGVTTVTGSYGAAVLPGINVNLGVSFTDHPTAITYTRSTGSALNVLLNTIIFL